MSAGELNRKVKLQLRSTSHDDYGQEINVWTDIATIWASIKPISGREKLKTGAVDSDLTHTVKIRYQESFMPPKTLATRRVLYGARILNITSGYDLDEAHRYIILECVEGSLDGQ